MLYFTEDLSPFLTVPEALLLPLQSLRNWTEEFHLGRAERLEIEFLVICAWRNSLCGDPVLIKIWTFPCSLQARVKADPPSSSQKYLRTIKPGTALDVWR